MYCPSCGKEIPDSSAFCLHCGKSINITTAPAQVATEWEYKDYVWYADSKMEIGTVRNMGNTGYSDIIQHAWLEVRNHLLEGIQDWLDEGWEPFAPIGSDCMIVDTQNVILLGTKVYLLGFSVKMKRRREIGSAAGKTQEREKTEFDVVMLSCGRNKIEVIKVIRILNPKMGLGDAKTLSETRNAKIATGVSRVRAENVAMELRRAGAIVEVK